MIETIIKRDGRKQEFMPSKINQWGEWASKTLGSKVDWSMVVLQTVSTLPKECTSETLQARLIKTCLDHNSWSYNRMAGRLYTAYINKKIYENVIPTIKDLHQKLWSVGLMALLNYSDEEYQEAEKIIDHKRDLKASHYELHQVRSKYSLKNRVSNIEYETQQFVYMRMAMALSEEQPKERRMKDVAAFYDHFSMKRLNAPTPNYVNLGTKHKGFASCCLYTTNDTAKSLAIGDHIAYTMTYMSAGIGSHINSRSINDPIRGGVIPHKGKLDYYRSLVGAVKANLQNGRGGAATTYYSVFDPEVEVISQLKNPMSTEDKKIRGIDYSMTSNKFFARKAAKNELIFLFNSFTAPDLYKAFYSSDEAEFERLYNKYDSDNSFKKTYINAREILLKVLNEGYETGRAYICFADEMNSHTPFKETIYSSNLCAEIALATKGYDDMRDLYSVEDHGRGEVAMCSLAAIVAGNIESDEQYEDVAYYALLMIDKCIHLSHYELPHVGVTAKARMSAGVGIIGMAHYLAKNKLSYMSTEGKQAIHKLSEKHMYMLIKGSLKLGQELGNAAWMHKTKWVDGWMPIDTYKKSVDRIASFELEYDWEGLRQQVIDNGGIRNTTLVAHMPTESSANASGTTNGLYPVRDLTLIKTDNSRTSYWAAPDGDKIGKYYDLAWDIPTKDMIDCYAIVQKFTDQAISADLYRRIIGDDTVTSKEMLSDYFYMVKMGLKTRYYVNSKTSDGTELNSSEDDCESCKL
jgi:ribonucleoside-diphosphate reductase alpha chain